ncbi:hypothetical protein E1B28_013105 [Marasmius oreades]|uniref:Uncharacterized protein n=1 Tax=Marasmius oreades TaxID=181124 RepID=A0A9P7RPX3_9AGAR|nr:uncharacterized protein E1B28_013105 [Marasmius oreades]KAG7087126.1 hypothetical protein E1B28_013105 [Marasmius oreades]
MLEPTPFLAAVMPPSDVDIPQIVREKEQLKLQLEAYLAQASHRSSSRTTVHDGTNEGNPDDDAVQALRYQMEALTRRTATLEEGMAPPDYKCIRKTSFRGSP